MRGNSSAHASTVHGANGERGSSASCTNASSTDWPLRTARVRPSHGVPQSSRHSPAVDGSSPWAVEEPSRQCDGQLDPEARQEPRRPSAGGVRGSTRRRPRECGRGRVPGTVASHSSSPRWRTSRRPTARAASPWDDPAGPGRTRRTTASPRRPDATAGERACPRRSRRRAATAAGRCSGGWGSAAPAAERRPGHRPRRPSPRTPPRSPVPLRPAPVPGGRPAATATAGNRRRPASARRTRSGTGPRLRPPGTGPRAATSAPCPSGGRARRRRHAPARRRQAAPGRPAARPAGRPESPEPRRRSGRECDRRTRRRVQLHAERDPVTRVVENVVGDPAYGRA